MDQEIGTYYLQAIAIWVILDVCLSVTIGHEGRHDEWLRIQFICSEEFCHIYYQTSNKAPDRINSERTEYMGM